MIELHAKKQMLSGYDAFFIREEIPGHVVYAEGHRTVAGRWEVYIKENGEELGFIQSERGKNFVMRMTMNAIIGCLSHLGKRGRMKENKANRASGAGASVEPRETTTNAPEKTDAQLLAIESEGCVSCGERTSNENAEGGVA